MVNGANLGVEPRSPYTGLHFLKGKPFLGHRLGVPKKLGVSLLYVSKSGTPNKKTAGFPLLGCPSASALLAGFPALLKGAPSLTKALRASPPSSGPRGRGTGQPRRGAFMACTAWARGFP